MSNETRLRVRSWGSGRIGLTLGEGEHILTNMEVDRLIADLKLAKKYYTFDSLPDTKRGEV